MTTTVQILSTLLSAIIAVAWCAAITLASYLWARAAFNRDPAR